MKSSESLAKLAPALTKAQAEFKGVAKSGRNTFDKYDYANLEDYVHAVRGVLASHGLSLLSSSEEIIPLEDRTTKNGGCEHAVRVKLTTRIVHESGEWIETSSCGEGQDRADKAVYKAITGARKYALASALNLATTDDPEQDDDHEPAPVKQQPRPAAKAPPEIQQLAADHNMTTGAAIAAEDATIADILAQIQTHTGYPQALQNLYDQTILSAYKAGSKRLREKIVELVKPAFEKVMPKEPATQQA